VGHSSVVQRRDQFRINSTPTGSAPRKNGVREVVPSSEFSRWARMCGLAVYYTACNVGATVGSRGADLIDRDVPWIVA
jgi:hypothetical protein